jgi:hypothetical protein
MFLHRAIGLGGWDWPSVFSCCVWIVSFRKWSFQAEPTQPLIALEALKRSIGR